MRSFSWWNMAAERLYTYEWMCRYTFYCYRKSDGHRIMFFLSVFDLSVAFVKSWKIYQKILSIMNLWKLIKYANAYSASKIESVGASRIFHWTLKPRGLKYAEYYGDGDSMEFLSIKDTLWSKYRVKIGIHWPHVKESGLRLAKIKI